MVLRLRLTEGFSKCCRLRSSVRMPDFSIFRLKRRSAFSKLSSSRTCTTGIRNHLSSVRDRGRPSRKNPREKPQREPLVSQGEAPPSRVAAVTRRRRRAGNLGLDASRLDRREVGPVDDQISPLALEPDGRCGAAFVLGVEPAEDPLVRVAADVVGIGGAEKGGDLVGLHAVLDLGKAGGGDETG